jgi:hypothetical protein
MAAAACARRQPGEGAPPGRQIPRCAATEWQCAVRVMLRCDAGGRRHDRRGGGAYRESNRGPAAFPDDEPAGLARVPVSVSSGRIDGCGYIPDSVHSHRADEPRSRD